MIRKYGKLIMMLICAAMVTACGSSQTAGPADGAAASGTEDPAGEEGTVDLAEKYSEIITHLENEEYDEAIEAINAMRPEPETETVSITLDNWQEYFSFVDDYRYEYDAQGAISETNYLILFQLKEEYQDRLVSMNGTVGYEYGDYVPHKVTSIDKENGSFDGFKFYSFDNLADLWIFIAKIQSKEKTLHKSEQNKHPKCAWDLVGNQMTLFFPKDALMKDIAPLIKGLIAYGFNGDRISFSVAP